MDNFVMLLPLFNHLQIHHPASQLYTPRTHFSILTRCSLQLVKTQDVNIPSQLTPNVWILTTPPSATTTAITLICPGETSKFITIQKPIHIL